jgi:hypothetical protein
VQEGIYWAYFIVGAIFSASALILTLTIVARSVFRLQDSITAMPINVLCWVVLLSGTVVGYAYCMELFMAYYSTSKYEGDAFMLRARYGPSAWCYYVMFFCNVFAPQLFWFKRARRNVGIALAVSILVNMGMLFERYVSFVARA